MQQKFRCAARSAALAVALVGWAGAASATGHAAAEAQTVEILKRAIAYRSVVGPGNQTPQLAAYLRQVLIAGGFADADVIVTPVDDTATLVARYRGRDATAKPLLLSGHMDVVEAKPADWKRDPFTPVIENGFIYGRGATDMKFGDATMIATLIDLKRAHYVPGRDIVLALSGDEETSMKTSAMIAAQFPDAALVLNADGGGGRIGDDGRPQFFDLEGAEKTYADFEIAFTNPGGHSSAPRSRNAIYDLARALERIGAYHFPAQQNDLTRAFFIAAAPRATPPIAAAMRAFAADPTDAAAIATLTAEPGYVGQIGTTCVATLVNGGHANNALPQRATANINCRIFPGTPVAKIQATLAEVVGDPTMTITNVGVGTVASDASPMRPDVTRAVARALAIDYRGVPIIPSMAAGASDNMHFRSHGVPSYGVSSLFMKDADDLSHGLDERTPIANVAPSINYWTSLITDLSR